MTKQPFMPAKEAGSAAIDPVFLGQAGVNYARQMLEPDGRFFTLLFSRFSAQSTAFAPLESGTDFERAIQFEKGGSLPVMAIRKWIVDYMKSCWSAEGYQLVFPDPWRKTTDLAKRPAGQPYFRVNDVICYVPQNTDGYTALRNGEREVMTYSFGVLVVAPSMPLPLAGQVLERKETQLLVDRVRAVLVSAYDHEGYVVWQK